MRGFVALGLLCLPALAAAQQTAPLVLTEGTPIRVRNVEQISSKDAQVGDPVSFEVDEDVDVDGQVVIAAGTPAYGEVTEAAKNGRIGKGGKLRIEVSYIKLPDRRLRTRGQRENAGDGKGGNTIVTTALLGPLGLLWKGKNAVIKPRTLLTTYVSSDTPVVAVPAATLPRR